MLVQINSTEHAVRCDVPGCDLEIAAPTPDEARDAAACAGFKFEKGAPAATQRHACPDCQRGVSSAIRAHQAAHQAAANVAQNAMAAGGAGAKDPDPTGWLN